MAIQMHSWCFIDFLFSTVALRTLSRNVHQEKCFSVTPSFKSWPLSVGNQNKNFPGRVHFHFQVGLSHWKGCVAISKLQLENWVALFLPLLSSDNNTNARQTFLLYKSAYLIISLHMCVWSNKDKTLTEALTEI